MALYKAEKPIKIGNYEISKGEKYLVERLKIEGGCTYFSVSQIEVDSERITDQTLIVPLKPKAEGLITDEQLNELLQQNIFIKL